VGVQPTSALEGWTRFAKHGRRGSIELRAPSTPLPESLPLKVVEHFACTVCGCVCDDLRLTVSGERIVRAENACFLAEPWLLGLNSDFPAVAEIEGQPVALESAVARAADILGEARYPLIYGLARSSTEGQSAAVALAEALGATIDTTASLCRSQSVMAQQQVGKVTWTLR